jgi:hypothetical protein
MKWYFKILIGLCSLLVFGIILNIVLNIWIKYPISKIISNKNDSAYFVTYKSINVSIWNSSIVANDIVIIPSKAVKDSLNKAGIYAEIKTIKVTKFKVWDVLFNDKIKAKSISIEKSNVVLYKKEQNENVRESIVGPFDKIISVGEVALVNANFKMYDVDSKIPMLNVQNINVQLGGIVVTKSTLEDKIPFQFKEYSVTCDSLYFHPNEFYNIKTNKIKITNSDIHIDAFQMSPTYSRREFVSKISKEKDLNTILCKTISVSNMDWGFKEEDFLFHCNAVDLNQVKANIYRSLEPKNDLSKKHLYSKLLRDLKFDLKVDTLKIRNSIVEYEEEKSFDLGPGKLRFNNFNLNATSINSGFKKDKLPDVNINISCNFMNNSPLNVNWKFNVMDRNDGFNIKGSLQKFDVEKIVAFTKPYMNVQTKGIIDQMHFDFTGNDKQVAGKFAVEYDDLEFKIFKKDNRKKKNKLATFIAKVFVQKDTNEKLKNVDVELERIPEKSFYNFLWRSIAEGLKKVLI